MLNRSKTEPPELGIQCERLAAISLRALSWCGSKARAVKEEQPFLRHGASRLVSSTVRRLYFFRFFFRC